MMASCRSIHTNDFDSIADRAVKDSMSKVEHNVTRNANDGLSQNTPVKSIVHKSPKNETFNKPESNGSKVHHINIVKSMENSLISGAKVYVRLDVRHPNAYWYDAILVSPGAGSDSYLVDAFCTVSDDGHIETCDDTTRFTVSKPNLAFSKPPDHVLPVSSHVVASLLSGIVAEKPNHDNGYKYLIFFENGIAEYFDQSELFLVSQGRYDFSNISVRMPVHYRVWLQDYFERYPQRLRPKFKKNEFISYNSGSYENPLWQKAQITRAKKQESLIHISIESTMYRGESIHLKVYRASPKLYKYHQLVSDYIKKNGESFNPSAVMDLITLDQQRHNNLTPKKGHLPPGCSKYTLSIRRLKPSLMPRKVAINRDNVENTLTLPVKGDKCSQLSPAPPIKLPEPKPFERHTCQASCSSIRVDLRTLRGLNPFLFPIYFGFRKDRNTSFYVSPCGTYLESMDQVQQYLNDTECVLDIDYFTFESINIYNDKASASHRHFHYTDDITNGLEFQPISLINFTDDKTLDPEYTYVADRILDQYTGYQKTIKCTPDEDIEEADPFLPCCDCTDNCSNPDTCSCVQLTMNEQFHRKASSCNSDEERTKGYEYKRLMEPAKFGIYECNRKCPCNRYCPNRVVQNGVKCVLQIFMTPDKGWGVRTLYDIPQGTFVSTYAARVMRDESVNELDVYTANLDFIECAEAHKEGYEEFCDTSTADELEMVDLESGYSSCSPKSDSQATATHHHTHHHQHHHHPRVKDSHSDTLPRRRLQKEQVCSNKKMKTIKSVRDFFPDEDPYVLDAQVCGNIGRFFNHSCDPNMFIQNVFIDTHDLRLPHVAFFTNQFVHAFDELTWDYSYEIDSVPNRQIDCKCGTVECRQRLL